MGVVVDKTNGDIYVADSNNHRIQVFDKHGIYVRKFGEFGTGKGQLAFPCDLEISNDGEIIVCDSANYCILFFTKNGKKDFCLF
jgi:DNA-binding beta-propeller fold protein YncE